MAHLTINFLQLLYKITTLLFGLVLFLIMLEFFTLSYNLLSINKVMAYYMVPYNSGKLADSAVGIHHGLFLYIRYDVVRQSGP